MLRTCSKSQSDQPTRWLHWPNSLSLGRRVKVKPALSRMVRGHIVKEVERVADPLKRLRDAVTGRGREVEVAADGTVREVNGKNDADDNSDKEKEAGKATKLAPRTFGA